VGGDGADAGDFVGGDGDTEAGAADEDGAVGVSGCDLLELARAVEEGDGVEG
jgi:hypothetical protein